MTVRLRSVHRRALWLVATIWLLGTLVCMLAAWRCWVAAESGIPKLTNGSQLAAALEWPWAEFPSVTEMERQTLQEKARLYEPLFRTDLRPWTDIPVDGLLGYPRDHNLRPSLEESAELMGKLAMGWSTSEVASMSWRPDPEQIQRARGLLAQASRGRPRWIPLYNSALLDLWTGAPIAAIEQLRKAQSLLDSYLENPERLREVPLSELARLYEASILSHYALGHALFESGRGSQEGAAAQRALASVEHFRKATELLTPLLDTGVGAYARATSPLRPFQLQSTKLGTAALWSDLIAAYMSAPGYQSCSRHPTRLPDCTREFQQGDTCGSRDQAVCQSLQTVSPRLQSALERLSEEAYNPNGQEEHNLWAFMTLVALTSASPSLSDDPYLLSNSAILLANLGESTLAGEQLDAAEKATDSDPGVRIADRSRIQKIHFLAQVLHGQPPEETESTSSEAVSLHRKAYYDLYEKTKDLSVRPFRLPRQLFSPSEQDIVDRWLFIRLWRELLRQGEFDRFHQEYEATRKVNVASDFFRQWRESVLRDLGRRALDKASENRKRGELDRAEEILSFITASGYFPDDVVRQARSESGLGGPALWKLTALLLLVVPQVLAIPYLVGLARLHRQTFFSSFREGRKKGFDAAYPS